MSFEAIFNRAVQRGRFSPVLVSDLRRRARRADAKAGVYTRTSLAHQNRAEAQADAYYDNGRDFSGRYEP